MFSLGRARFFPANLSSRIKFSLPALIILLYLASIVGAGIAYQNWATYRDRQRSQLPGRFVQTKYGALYLHQQGQGSPTVLLESGLAASSLSWALVQEPVAEFAQVCSYDRAGFGWSLPASQPRTVGNVIAELTALLKNAGLQGPYLLVGHSFGGLLVRAFAHQYPDDVAGVVLVDPVSIQYWSECGPNDQKRLRSGARLSQRGAWLARLGVVRLALFLLGKGRTRLPQLIARTSSGKANDLISRLAGEVRKLPPAVWPLLQAHWSRSYPFDTMAAYLQNLPQNAREAARMDIPAQIPLTILSAANATECELQERERWAKHSRNGRHIQLKEGGHWIQFEYPETVVAAVRNLVNSLR